MDSKNTEEDVDVILLMESIMIRFVWIFTVWVLRNSEKANKSNIQVKVVFR